MIDLGTWKKAWALLDLAEKRRAWLVFSLIVVSAFASAAMVGSVMPFIAVMAEPSRIEEAPALAWAYSTFGFTSDYQFIVALGLASFIVIVLASLIQILRTWVVARFSMMRIHSIGHRLLAAYLLQPYSFFLDRHSGEMSQRVLAETEQVVMRFMRFNAEFISSVLTTLAIVAFLLWVKPVVAMLSFAVLGGIYFAVYLTSRRRLHQHGEARVEANNRRFRFANESLTGIKDIKLLGREQYYLDRYAEPSVTMARSQAGISVLSQIPQYALQAVGLSGVILLCLMLIDPADTTGGNLGEILPILGVFALAGQRLMPEFSKIYASLAEMQAGAASVNVVYTDLVKGKTTNLAAGQASNSIGLRSSLEIKGVSFTYSAAKRASLRAVSLHIKAGEKIGIVGGTGAGKTTFADILLGLLEPDEGSLIVDGVEITQKNMRGWMQGVGYVPQDIFLTDSSVAENIALGFAPETIDRDRLRRAARVARIEDFILQEMPQGYETLVGERGVRLSGGQRQRIGIARALYHDAELIVFDEATSALDNLTERDVMEAIDALPGDKTILIIAHRLSTVRRCDRIVVLEQGQIVGCGSWNALMAENAFFQRIAQVGEPA